MTIQVILPSKKQIDVRPFRVDFSQWLLSGEEVIEATITVSMYTGDDPAPEEILYLDPEILNNVVLQRIRAGIPGNIYTVTMKVVTDLGNEFTAETLQAVLPDGVPASDIYIPLYLTTRPYPVNDIEGIEAGLGYLSSFILTVALDGVDHGVTLSTGSLRNILQQYGNWPPEAIDHAVSLQAGSMKDILIQYGNYPAEAIDHSCTVQASSLRNLLISYNNYPAEAVDHSCSLISGSLT